MIILRFISLVLFIYECYAIGENCRRMHLENTELHPSVRYRGYNGDVQQNDPRWDRNGYRCNNNEDCYVDVYFRKFYSFKIRKRKKFYLYCILSTENIQFICGIIFRIPDESFSLDHIHLRYKNTESSWVALKTDKQNTVSKIIQYIENFQDKKKLIRKLAFL